MTARTAARPNSAIRCSDTEARGAGPRSPEADSRTAGRPSAAGSPWSETVNGSARRDPLAAGVAPPGFGLELTSRRAADSTVRTRPIGGCAAPVGPRDDERLAHASRRPCRPARSPRRSALRRCAAPTGARPRCRPCRRRSRRARASCAARGPGRRARARAAPPCPRARASPGTLRESRLASTTMRRLERPGRTPVDRGEVALAVDRAQAVGRAPGGELARAAAPARRDRRAPPSPAEPGRRDGNAARQLAQRVARRLARRAERARRRRTRPRPGGVVAGARPVGERERAHEEAISAGRKAARYRRLSSTDPTYRPSPGSPDPNALNERLTFAPRLSDSRGRPRSPHPPRRRRAADPDAAVVPAAARRLRGRARVRRPRGARALLRADVRPRRARRDAAADGRPRGLPAAAREGRARPDHHAHAPRARRSTRSSGSSSGADDYITKPFSMREFRSRVKAALRRAGMARQRRRRRGAGRGRRPADRPGQAHRAAARRHGPDHVRRVRDPQRAGAQPRPRVHARHAARARVGRLGLPRPAHRSTSTSGTCARSSRPTRRSRSTSSPCAASATASATRSELVRPPALPAQPPRPRSSR